MNRYYKIIALIVVSCTTACENNVSEKPTIALEEGNRFLGDKPIYEQKKTVQLMADSIINFTAKIPGRFLDSGKAYIYFFDKIRQDYFFIHGKGVRGGNLQLVNYPKKKITQESNYYNVKISFSILQNELDMMELGKYQVRLRYTNSPLDYGDYRYLSQTFLVDKKDSPNMEEK